MAAGCGGAIAPSVDAAATGDGAREGGPSVDASTPDAGLGDADAADGAADAKTESASPCPTGKDPCGDVCTSLESDPDNCGACGKRCPAGLACTAGDCSCECPAGLICCVPDGGAALCANLSTDDDNCGSCGASCPSGQVCTSGVGHVICGMGLVDCAGACIDPRSSSLYCGATGNCAGANAGTTCQAGSACVNGECTCECAPGLIVCGGPQCLCVDPITNVDYCGATVGCGYHDAGSAGAVCATGQVCDDGSCQ